MSTLVVSDSIYRSLPHSQCTRLIEVLDSTPSQQHKLRLRMTVIDLRDLTSLLHDFTNDDDLLPERYDALSYTWGSPLSTSECEALYSPAHDVDVIVTDEGVRTCSMKIGRNLYKALLQLYDTAPERRIWIDALCIHQSDLEEKQTHILLMSEIYSKAQRVFVWLGRDDPQSPEFKHIIRLHTTVLDEIETWSKENRPVQFSDFYPIEDGSGVGITPMKGFLLANEDLRALYRFYAHRRYLTRAWVMQEVALAKACIVLLGDHQIWFERLSAFNRQIMTLGGMTAEYIQQGPTQHPPTGQELTALWINALQLRGWQVSSMVGDLRQIFGAFDDETTYLSLLEYQMGRESQRMSADPRDLIYCLLGMAKAVHPNIGDPIKPDYTASVEDVYTQFTTLLLKKLPYRSILSLVTEKSSIAQQGWNLPSWVPDFTTSTENSVPIWFSILSITQAIPDFFASIDDEEFSRLEIQGRTLSLFARRCGKLDMQFRLPLETHTASEGFLMRDTKFLTHIMQVVVQMVERGKIASVERLFRVLCWGALAVPDDQIFQRMWHRFMAAGVLETDLHSPNNPAVQAATRRLKHLFDSAPGIPSIPSGKEFEREEDSYRLIRKSEKLKSGEDDEAIMEGMEKLMALFPEWFSYDVTDKEASDQVDDDIKEKEFEAFAKYLTTRVDPRSGLCDMYFTIAQGQVGRIAATIQSGDELWLLCRARAPFVLRPLPTGEYQIVAETYVYGAMDGELVSSGVAGKPQEIRIV